jgi:paraquat-inducible protein A
LTSTFPAQFGSPPLGVAPPAAAGPVPPAEELVACTCCGLAQVMRRPRQHEIAHCGRCGAVLETAGAADLKIPLALAVTGLFLAAIANLMPLLTVRLAGIVQPSLLISGPLTLGRDGLGPLGVLVAALSILIPLIWLASVAYVLLSLELGRQAATLAPSFKLAERLRPLAMVDVYLLGGFVAFTRLRELAVVEIGPGGWALAALAFTMVAVDAALDRRRIWDLIRPPRNPPPSTADTDWEMCEICGFLIDRAGTAATPGNGEAEGKCPRCSTAITSRKPNSVVRTWALVIAGCILYVPANLLPVLTVIRFGDDRPSTILGGVRQLIDAHDWPLALIVLLASVVVPLFKMIGLGWLALSIALKMKTHLVERTRLYRAIDAIGRWANIDIFAISTLVALVRFGSITSIEPGVGAVVFAAVVVVTMLAAATFDPRLMWDAAEGRDAG